VTTRFHDTLILRQIRPIQLTRGKVRELMVLGRWIGDVSAVCFSVGPSRCANINHVKFKSLDTVLIRRIMG